MFLNLNNISAQEMPFNTSKGLPERNQYHITKDSKQINGRR